MDIQNFRDIGNVNVGGGRSIRPGLLFRSAELSDASAESLAQLSQLGISDIVDLRTDAEILARPGPQVPGIDGHHFDVFGDAQAIGVSDIAAIEVSLAAAKASMISAYQNMIVLPSAHRAYRQLIEIVLQGRPVLFHCTEGKDRTGWAASLMLNVLHASRNQVAMDYLLSGICLEKKNAETIKSLQSLNKKIPVAALDIYLSVSLEFLDAAYSEFQRVYGSFDGYIREALELNDRDIQDFREICLIS